MTASTLSAASFDTASTGRYFRRGATPLFLPSTASLTFHRTVQPAYSTEGVRFRAPSHGKKRHLAGDDPHHRLEGLAKIEAAFPWRIFASPPPPLHRSTHDQSLNMVSVRYLLKREADYKLGKIDKRAGSSLSLPLSLSLFLFLEEIQR